MAFSDLAQSTLTATIASGDTTIAIVSTSKYATGGGYLNIDNELLSYAAISGNSFTGCVRGLGSPVATTASGHNSGAIVTGVVVATQLTALTPPSFATPAIALSTAAAAGSAATVIRSDGTIAAFDATVPTSSAVGDSAAAGSAAVAARRDHAHGREAFGSAPPAVAASGATGSATTEARSDHVHAGLGQPLALTGATQATRYAGATTSGAPVSGTFAVGDFVIDRTGSAWVCTAAGTPGTWTQVSGSTSFATPAILLAASAAAGAASTAIRSDATIAAFDATAPTTSNPGDAAAVGSIAFAARRDHLHGREATAAPVSDGSRAYNSGTVSTASSTETAVTMDSERSDSAAFHSTSTNTSRMTIPTGKAGRYTIAGTVEWAASALGTVRRLSIRLNGSTYIAKNEITSILNVVLPQEVSTVYDLADGDYVELMAFQDTVGAVLLNASGNYSPEFAISAGGASGGGGVSQSYIGYNTAGGSFGVLGYGVSLFKQITLAAAGTIASIDSYLSMTASGTGIGLTVGVYTDSSGVPANIIAVAGLATSNYNFQLNNTARWISLPVGTHLPADTYWIFVHNGVNTTTTLSIAYNATGSDRTQTGANSNVVDVSISSTSSTANQYSIRASLLSGL